jgi:PAS domain-containing protein
MARRWRFDLVEETESLPVPWRPPEPREPPAHSPGAEGAAALLAAVELLRRRGSGSFAWAASFRDDPIAFLLDAVSDAISIWDPGGTLLYRNGAATALGLEASEESPLEIFDREGRRFERRCVRYRFGETERILEIVREI